MNSCRPYKSEHTRMTVKSLDAYARGYFLFSTRMGGSRGHCLQYSLPCREANVSASVSETSIDALNVLWRKPNLYININNFACNV